MAGRRYLIAIVLLAAVLHGVGIAKTILPAQDGLKFIRIAREFQFRPWADVVRNSDQHPLYPALIALTAQGFALLAGDNPTTWRIAAQVVSTLASLLLLVPLYGLSRSLFDARIAALAALIYVLLPFQSEIGHDTLSDSLALCVFLAALRLGDLALRSTSRYAPAACGLVAGLGFLARPEVLIAPAAVVITGFSAWRSRAVLERRLVPQFATLGLAFLVMVGTYALFKGEISEKLALRMGASLAPHRFTVRNVDQWLPPGLDDKRWDFSPKEEHEGWSKTGAARITGRLLQEWVEGLGWIFAFFALWGVVRDRFIRGVIGRESDDGPDLGRRLIVVYLLLFSAALVRHSLKMGYLSGRHTLTLVAVSLPWAAAGTFICARGIAVKLHWSAEFSRSARIGALGLLIAVGVYLQVKPGHPSRWGHWAAGRWLVENSRTSDAVLDTRGWAAFSSDRPSYDYWHVRQAFTDSHLAYIVVGTDELTAESRRAKTLRAVLSYAATPVAAFPEMRGGSEPGVEIYRFRRPDSWEGIRE
jgi:hypothetical protein